MSRVDCLGRTGMYHTAFKHILEKDKEFPYTKEDWDKIDKTRKYDPCKGTTSRQFDRLCDDINEWLNEHYDMFELDYTHFDDWGSRDEVVLCYKKGEGKWHSPDFATELPQLVLYR